MHPGVQTLAFDQFKFVIEYDRGADPINGTAVWVWYCNEPCCDDNGHQYRFYLPIGIRYSSMVDCCRAFAAACHNDPFRYMAA